MTDYAGASISIGGTLARALLPDFLAAITADRLCVDYGDRILEEADIVSGIPLYGAAAAARGAQFEETEGFCRAHALRYIRRSDACAGGWDPSIEIFTGGDDVLAFDATSSGTVVITLDDFRRLGSLAAIEAHFGAADFDPGPLTLIDR